MWIGGIKNETFVRKIIVLFLFFSLQETKGEDDSISLQIFIFFMSSVNFCLMVVLIDLEFKDEHTY